MKLGRILKKTKNTTLIFDIRNLFIVGVSFGIRTKIMITALGFSLFIWRVGKVNGDI